MVTYHIFISVDNGVCTMREKKQANHMQLIYLSVFLHHELILLSFWPFALHQIWHLFVVIINYHDPLIFSGRLKSPWSRKKKKHALSPRQWRSLLTPEGKLRDGGVKLLKKVRSGVSYICTRFIYDCSIRKFENCTISCFLLSIFCIIMSLLLENLSLSLSLSLSLIIYLVIF